MAMTHALVRREAQSALLAPQTFQEALAFAERIAGTDFVPQDMRGNAGAVLAAIQYGAELGLPPMQALNSLVVIRGNVGMKVELMVALIIDHPECEKFERTYEPVTQVATVIIKRRGRPEVTVTFGLEDARKVPVKENDRWITLAETTRYKAWPQRMYQARAAGFAIRDEFPDVIRGLRTDEEVATLSVDRGTDASEAQEPRAVKDAAWSWVPEEIQPSVREAFELCALTTAKQRVLLFQYKDKGHDALLEYLRSEYAARNGRKRATKTAETPAASAPASQEASTAEAATPTAASPPTADIDPAGTYSSDPEPAPPGPARKNGPGLLTANDIPWGKAR